ncbi:alpha/beta hydrolase [Gilvimarinus agarilyticus]|uniref:alpha/beta hydrolase n=1 Tax=Gilvimarinus agarilyticus TaxID=679259 RepID=UPI0005A1C9A2|nr:alpha/beta hydrolase-fold protein [Gilvimarinus agarilyticus]
MSIQQIESSADASDLPAGLKYLTVHSSALKGRGNISCYNAASKQQELPIVMLLHGVYGNHWVWMNLGRVHEVYDELRRNGEIGEMLLVMPEDGSYYAGSGYLPLSNGQDFDAWIMEDALSAVTQSLACVSERSKVYLSGLSMGGYGALRLGAKHAARVSGISAHSSITCMDDFKHFVKEDLSIYRCNDANEADLLHWFSQNRHQLPPIRLDCGTDDVLFNSNQALTTHLSNAGIDHDFEAPSGGHEWSYWNIQVAKTLRFFDRIHRRA